MIILHLYAHATHKQTYWIYIRIHPNFILIRKWKNYKLMPNLVTDGDQFNSEFIYVRIYINFKLLHIRMHPNLVLIHIRMHLNFKLLHLRMHLNFKRLHRRMHLNFKRLHLRMHLNFKRLHLRMHLNFKLLHRRMYLNFNYYINVCISILILIYFRSVCTSTLNDFTHVYISI